jgi:phosphocarrier protein HPr
MKEIQLTIVSETGLHSRPADLFVRTAKLYKSVITVRNGEKASDAKNIIKVILLNVMKGQSMTVSADGPDEDAALTSLRKLVESDFSDVDERVKI